MTVNDTAPFATPHVALVVDVERVGGCVVVIVVEAVAVQPIADVTVTL